MEERFLLFRAAGDNFAVKLQEIAEVMEPAVSFAIPRAPRHFTGLMNFHGTLTVQVDLGLYLGQERRIARGKVLVLDLKGTHLALLVESVGSIIAREGIIEERAGEDELTPSLLDTEQGTFRLLQLEALIFALEQGL